MWGDIIPLDPVQNPKNENKIAKIFKVRLLSTIWKSMQCLDKEPR